MNKLLWLLIVALILAYVLRDRCVIKGRHSYNKEKIFMFALILLLGIYCGLRTWFNDTVTYLQMYQQTTSLAEFWSSEDMSLARGLGFGIVNSIMKDLGFSSQDYLMFYALSTVTFYVCFVRKYSINFSFSVFLMFATGFYMFSFAAIKQCIALGICLVSISCAIEKNWRKYIVGVVIASLFHPYSIIFFLVVFMIFRPLSKKTYLCICIAVLSGFALNYLLRPIVSITTMMGANYSASSFIGEGVSTPRVLVAFVPLMLSFFYRDKLFKDSSDAENMLFNLAMLNALIMFVGLFGTANYFARLANYFLPAQVIVLPWMLKKIGGKDKQILSLFCVIGYLGYFVYENAVLKKFDTCFSQVSFLTYLKSHF